jgi:DNA-nicking Smr family endonuclease
MDGVTPLENRNRRRATPSRRDVPSPPSDPDAEAYATLSALVSGNIPFDFVDTDEYVEGYVEGFDRGVVRKLSRGEFSIQGHLDLHGLSRQEARAEVERFVTRSVVAGQRCVLIIHGRGRHSPDQTPVLKDVVRAWLSRGKIGRSVLAFTSARPVDGGAGALYVLLRRTPR